MGKKTLVIGASTNPDRFSFKAIHKLAIHKHEVIALGNKEGMVAGLKIVHGYPEIHDLHTVTLYVNSKIQEDYIDYILDLKPKRIIFNPGTENAHFEKLARHENIEVVNACTLILIAANRY